MIELKQDERQHLQAECVEVMGNTEPVLAEVLSFFPERAELFIKTQKHAAQIEGKKGVWYTVRHKESGSGLGNTYYQRNQWEHLGVHGYTGESVMKTIREIRELRGEREGDFGYAPSTDGLASIVRVAKMERNGEMEEWDQMTAKVIEVMKVSPEEVDLLENYLTANTGADEIEKKARELEEQAKSIRDAAKTTRSQARSKVEEKYPRGK